MIYKAIANGDFSTLAIWQTWDGTAWANATVLPSQDDDVYSNNFIVAITSDVFVNSFNRSSLSSPEIAQGGQFQITGANEITLEGLVNGSNVNLVANNPLSACVNRLATHINKFHRIGDDVGGSRNVCYAFWNDSAYNIDIIGNQIGGTGTHSYGFFNNASSTFNSIIGNQIGGAARGFVNNASSTFNSIIGNQIGGNAQNTSGFSNTAASTFNSIIGNQIGGSSNTAYGFYNTAASTFNSIIGNQIGGSSNTAYGFYNYAANTFFSEITGMQSGIPSFGFYNTENLCEITFIASEAYPQGIYNTSATTIINFGGKSYNNLQTGVMAIRSNGNVNFDLSEFRIGLTPILNEIVLYPATVLENPPAIKDVRTGIVYGIGNNYTGTLAVPPAESVVKNVPTDDTVGTWAFDDDLIERLKHCATTEIVDVQLASYQNT